MRGAGRSAVTPTESARTRRSPTCAASGGGRRTLPSARSSPPASSPGRPRSRCAGSTSSAGRRARRRSLRSSSRPVPGSDVVEVLERIRTPTLVVHGRNDQVVPLSEGRLLASAIPGAEFVELDSSNHILLESEPAWERFRGAVLEFTGLGRTVGEDPVFRRLTAREREVLTLLSEGLGKRRHRRAAGAQREDGPEPRLQPVRQARGLVPRPGDRLREGPGIRNIVTGAGPGTAVLDARANHPDGEACRLFLAPVAPGTCVSQLARAFEETKTMRNSESGARPPSTGAVLQNHLRGARVGVDAVMDDYTEQSVLMTHDATYRGLAEIRKFFTTLFRDLPKGFFEGMRIGGRRSWERWRTSSGTESRSPGRRIRSWCATERSRSRRSRRSGRPGEPTVITAAPDVM